MSLQYSLGLCYTSIIYLTSNETFENRLIMAFSEMSVSKENDTSDEIYKKWILLRDEYHSNDKNDMTELKKIGENLVGIIIEWIEYNNRHIEI
jgi:hypothetical protein